MGQQVQRRTPGPPDRQPDPSWSTVAGTTVRLWLQRHHVLADEPTGRRRRFVVLVCALVAMALGAGVTLAFTRTSDSDRTASGAPGNSGAITQAAANRHAAAAWVASQVARSTYVSCDPQMCSAAQSAGYPVSQLVVLQSTAPDPLGGALIIATPAIQSQFGSRLASVYAPLVLASFGSGTGRVDIRYVPPVGTKAFEGQLPADRKARIEGGAQLLTNKRIQPSLTAKSQLLAGQVDPRLLITLSAIAGTMTGKAELELVAFDDSSPGASPDVPLRGAEIGASTPAGLSAVLAFLKAQQTDYAPAGQPVIVKDKGGQQVVTVRYAAPGPLDVGSS
jgi:hypothetical protein